MPNPQTAYSLGFGRAAGRAPLPLDPAARALALHRARHAGDPPPFDPVRPESGRWCVFSASAPAFLVFGPATESEARSEARRRSRTDIGWVSDRYIVAELPEGGSP